MLEGVDQDGRPYASNPRSGRAGPLLVIARYQRGQCDGVAVRKTYTIIPDPPPPMDWRAYEKCVKQAWAKLLAGEPTEAEVQDFFERHPSMVPGAFDLIGGTSGHGPMPPAVISQPPLPAFTRRVPDFMWIAKDSLSIYPVLIEIEAPRKIWFTKSGQPTSDLTQAINQLSEWKSYFSDPHNQSSFIKYYGLEGGMFQKPLKPRYVLIYGRRREFDTMPQAASKRAAMEAPDQVLMTYDRLAPDLNSFDFFSVKLKKDSKFHTLFVPPSATLGPMLADGRAKLQGKVEAVARSPYLTASRRKFLESRIEYWDDWVSAGSPNFFNLADEE